MMPYCQPFDAAKPFLTSVISYSDCRSLYIAEGALRLIMPGSLLGIILTPLLTIVVALFGFRMMTGQVPTVRTLVILAVKVGFVLSLATQWSSYRTLFFDVANAAPAAVLGNIAPNINTARTVNQIDRTFISLSRLAQLAEPGLQPSSQPARTGTENGEGNPVSSSPPGLTSAATLLQHSAIVLMLSSIAGVLSLRVVTAFALAVGPLIATSLLFESTRGVFFSWLRVLGGAILGSAAINLLMSVELGILDSQVRLMQALTQANRPLGFVPAAVFTISLGGGLAMLFVTLGAARIGHGLQFLITVVDGALPLRSGRWGEASRSTAVSLAVPDRTAGDFPTRALSIADSVRAVERRQSSQRIPQTSAEAATEPGTRSSAAGPASLSIGQLGRRTMPRATNSASRRDALP